MAIAVMALAAWGYWRRIDWAEQAQIEGSTLSNFGGNDWVVWEDTENGVRVRSIHPLVKGNPQLYDQFFREGDILRRIEFDSPEDVYRAEMVRELTRHTAPGTMVLYWVERSGNVQPGGGWRSLLISHSF